MLGGILGVPEICDFEPASLGVSVPETVCSFLSAAF